MKKLRVELELNIENLPDDIRQQCMELGGHDSLPTLETMIEEEGADESAEEVAEVLSAVGNHPGSAELFAGTGMYLKFSGARVVSARWAE